MAATQVAFARRFGEVQIHVMNQYHGAEHPEIYKLSNDMYAAYERMSPAWKKKIEGRKAVHNLDFSRTRRHGHDPMTPQQKAKVPPVAHPIVRTHPETGRKAIFLGDHAELE